MSNKIIVKDHKYYFKIRGLGGVKGDKGDTGPAGPQGPQGPYVDVVAGTTTTLPAGSSAQVTVNNTGNTSVLNFGIPQGLKGDKGDAGTPGAQGPRGFAATVNVGQTTTGEPGTDASVVNAGNEHNAVLKFTIPKGAKGDTGATGPQGPTGGVKSTVVAELPETGESDKYYLVNRTAEGGTVTTTDGYAQITNDENAGGLTLNKLDGNATQKTLSGKNKLNTNNFTTHSSGGITTTWSNNVGTASGTTTATSFIATDTVSASIPAGTYTFSIQTAVPYRVVIALYNSDTSSWANDYTMSANQRTITFTTNFTASSWRIGVSSIPTGTVISNLKIDRPMLESGSTATDFEPYCGGVPMPNPQFPSPVETVTGGQTVKIPGKNLAKIDPATRTSNGITYIWSADGSVTLNGTATAISATEATDDYPINLRAGQVYTFSANNAEISSGVTIRLERGNGKTGVMASGITSNTNQTWSFNGEDTDARLQVRVASGTTLSNFVIRPQLELDSTATDYEPCQEQSQVINLGGTNLLTYPYSDTPNSPVTRYDVEWTDLGDGTVKANGTPSGASIFVLASASDYITVKPNTVYTISGGNKTKGVVFTSNERDSSGNVLVTHDNIETLTFTTNASTTRLDVSLKRYSNSVTINNFVCKPMLQLGSVATPFAPYTTYAYELAKIGTYQDYIWNDNGTWKIHKEIHKVVLDGTETEWSIRNTGTDRYYYRLRYLSDVHYLADGSEWISDKLSTGIVGETTTDEGCFIVSGGELRIRYGTEMSLTDWKDYLKDHNITLYYQAETPTDTEITDSELIEQLNHIYELYQGTNNLWLIPSAGAQGEFTGDYVVYDKYNKHQVYIWSSDDNTWQIILP